jgi:hypothetical protein
MNMPVVGGFASVITPASNVVPTAHEVAPWVALIERLWDDAEILPVCVCPVVRASNRRRAPARPLRSR